MNEQRGRKKKKRERKLLAWKTEQISHVCQKGLLHNPCHYE